MSLELNILNCQKCDKYKDMPCGPVRPYGKSKIILIGECPGQNEAIVGEPFIGLCGKFMDKYLLEPNQLSRKDLYITNLVKCVSRVGNKNVPLSPETIKICGDWLIEEIKEIQPKLIITLGRQSTFYLLKEQIKKTFKLGDIVGKIYSYCGIDVMPCYHPSYLMARSSKNIPKAKQVFSKIKDYL